MYENNWGLTESPFRRSLDDRWYFHSRQHDEALARLLYVVENREPHGMLTGPAGTGKSLLLRVLAGQLRRTPRKPALINLLGMDGNELQGQLLTAFKISPAESRPALRAWRALYNQLKGLTLANSGAVVLLDHCDQADEDCHRAIERLLSLFPGHDGPLTLILAARDRHRLSPALTELSPLRIELAVFDHDETADYVRASLKRVGCTREMFDDGALQAVFERTGGIVREINRLCELALMAALGERCDCIDADIIGQAALELDMGTPTAPQQPDRTQPI